jgi:hypothetical protein
MHSTNNPLAKKDRARQLSLVPERGFVSLRLAPVESNILSPVKYSLCVHMMEGQAALTMKRERSTGKESLLAN